jgi:hypothetical protein
MLNVSLGCLLYVCCYVEESVEDRFLQKKNEACLIGRGRGEGGFNLRLMTVRDRHQPLRDVWCTVSSRNLAS